MFSDEVKEIARKIGDFYLQKHNADYRAAQNELQRLNITDIKTGPGNANLLVAANLLEERGFLYASEVLRLKGKGLDDGIEIRTGRPGILIGPRGRNIEALEKFLGIKIRIVEETDSLLDHLTPINYEDYE